MARFRKPEPDPATAPPPADALTWVDFIDPEEPIDDQLLAGDEDPEEMAAVLRVHWAKRRFADHRRTQERQT